MHKSLIRRCLNRALHVLARSSPGATSLRPMLHRARGVKIGRDVFIGDDVFIDNEFPESVEIRDGVQISIRAVIIAHTRGAGRVVLEEEAFIGPHCVVAASAGRVLTVGRGAVVSAGCVVTKNVPPHAVLVPPPFKIAARATVPMTTARTMEEFYSGLRPVAVREPKTDGTP